MGFRLSIDGQQLPVRTNAGRDFLGDYDDVADAVVDALYLSDERAGRPVRVLAEDGSIQAEVSIPAR